LAPPEAEQGKGKARGSLERLVARVVSVLAQTGAQAKSLSSLLREHNQVRIFIRPLIYPIYFIISGRIILFFYSIINARPFFQR